MGYIGLFCKRGDSWGEAFGLRLFLFVCKEGGGRLPYLASGFCGVLQCLGALVFSGMRQGGTLFCVLIFLDGKERRGHGKTVCLGRHVGCEPEIEESLGKRPPRLSIRTGSIRRNG